MEKEADIMGRRWGEPETQIGIIEAKGDQERRTMEQEMLLALRYQQEREAGLQSPGSSIELVSTPFESPMHLQRAALQALDIYYTEGVVGHKELVEKRQLLTRGQWEWLRKAFIATGILLVAAKGSRKAGRLGYATEAEAIARFTKWLTASGGGPGSQDGPGLEQSSPNSSGPRPTRWGVINHQLGAELQETDLVPER